MIYGECSMFSTPLQFSPITGEKVSSFILIFSPIIGEIQRGILLRILIASLINKTNDLF